MITRLTNKLHRISRSIKRKKHLLLKHLGIATAPKKPIEVYAFVRVSNEALTVKASLDSIKDVITKGIIAWHPPLPGVAEDGTREYLQQFVAQNPGYRYVEYPVPIIPPNSNFIHRHLELCQSKLRYNLLDCFYNFALLHLERLARDNGDYDHAYAMKIDCDHVYARQALNHMLTSFREAVDWYDAEFISHFKLNVVANYNLVSSDAFDDQIFDQTTLQLVQRLQQQGLIFTSQQHYFCHPVIEQCYIPLTGDLQQLQSEMVVMQGQQRGRAAFMPDQQATQLLHTDQALLVDSIASLEQVYTATEHKTLLFAPEQIIGNNSTITAWCRAYDLLDYIQLKRLVHLYQNLISEQSSTHSNRNHDNTNKTSSSGNSNALNRQVDTTPLTNCTDNFI